MYTLCWTRRDIDGWDIFKSIEDMEEKVKELMKEGFCTDDMMIFTQRDYIVPEEDGTVII